MDNAKGNKKSRVNAKETANLAKKYHDMNAARKAALGTKG